MPVPECSNRASSCHVWHRPRCDKPLCFFQDPSPIPGCSLPTGCTAESHWCRVSLTPRSVAVQQLSGLSAHLQVGWVLSLFPSRGRKLPPAICVLRFLSLFPQKLLFFGCPITQVSLSSSLLISLFIWKASQHITIKHTRRKHQLTKNKRWLLTRGIKSTKETHQEKGKFRKEIAKNKFNLKSKVSHKLMKLFSRYVCVWDSYVIYYIMNIIHNQQLKINTKFT